MNRRADPFNDINIYPSKRSQGSNSHLILRIDPGRRCLVTVPSLQLHATDLVAVHPATQALAARATGAPEDGDDDDDYWAENGSRDGSYAPLTWCWSGGGGWHVCGVCAMVILMMCDSIFLVHCSCLWISEGIEILNSRWMGCDVLVIAVIVSRTQKYQQTRCHWMTRHQDLFIDATRCKAHSHIAKDSDWNEFLAISTTGRDIAEHSVAFQLLSSYYILWSRPLSPLCNYIDGSFDSQKTVPSPTPSQKTEFAVLWSPLTLLSVNKFDETDNGLVHEILRTCWRTKK